MIILESVRFKNLLSYGEQWTEFRLNSSEHVTVITAKNGHGKSTITEAICLGLFNKSIRKSKKPNLVNRQNKRGLLIEIKFSVDGDKYLVRRGIKPDIFEIYKNDFENMINQDASSRDYQKILENNILRMNYITFTQSVIISKTLYTPFMTLPAPKRLEFIENILKLRIFGTMSKLHKDNLDSVKKDIQAIDGDVLLLQSKISTLKNNKESISRMIQQNSEEKRNYINQSIQDNQQQMITLGQEYKKLSENIGTPDETSLTEYSNKQTILNKLEAKLDVDNNELKKLQNTKDECPHCGNKVDISHLDKLKDELNANIEKINLYIIKTKDELNGLTSVCDEIKKIKQKNLVIENEMCNIKSQCQMLNRSTEKLKSELNFKIDTSELDTVEKDIYNTQHELDKKLEVQNIINKKFRTYNLITLMLKDTGIKSSVINQSIPLINKLINKNLNDFGFFVKFELDSEFNEKILVSGFDPASYSDFSEGEKLRIDMAILLAWRELSSLQNSNSCNVLFLDEITDASMDADGIEVFTKMLSLLKKNNVFIITHKPEKLDNIARHTINIEKIDRYSKIK